MLISDYVLEPRVDVDAVKDALRAPGAMSELEVQWLLNEALAAIEQLEERVYDDDYDSRW